METDANPAEAAARPEGAHTSSHKRARLPLVELITRGERRRRWTVEQKQTIAAQSLAPGTSPTEVARQHGIGTGQLYGWRQALLAAQPVGAAVPGRFARVEVAAGKPAPRAPEGGEAAAPTPQPARPAPAGAIEIALPNGTTLRVDPQVDPRALRRVLAVLRG